MNTPELFIRDARVLTLDGDRDGVSMLIDIGVIEHKQPVDPYK